MAVLAVFAVVLVLLVLWSLFRRRRQLRFVEQYEFPAPLAQKLRERHPDLTPLQTERALDALRQWFVACHFAEGKLVAMPSRVADDAWHEFILMTRLYHSFCDKAYGRYLHHTPDAVSEKPIRPALPTTLEAIDRYTAKRGGDAAVAVGALPLLFTVDEELGVGLGHGWTRERIAQQELQAGVACLGGASALKTEHGGCGGCSGCGGCGDCG